MLFFIFHLSAAVTSSNTATVSLARTIIVMHTLPFISPFLERAKVSLNDAAIMRICESWHICWLWLLGFCWVSLILAASDLPVFCSVIKCLRTSKWLVQWSTTLYHVFVSCRTFQFRFFLALCYYNCIPHWHVACFPFAPWEHVPLHFRSPR